MFKLYIFFQYKNKCINNFYYIVNSTNLIVKIFKNKKFRILSLVFSNYCYLNFININ